PRDHRRYAGVPDRGRPRRGDPVYREQRHVHRHRQAARPRQLGDDRADELGDPDAPHAEPRLGDGRPRRPDEAARVDQRPAMKRFAFVVLAACGDNRLSPDARPGDSPRSIDAPADTAIDAMPDANPATPAYLLDTGLCLDPSCTQISPDVT